MRSFIISIGLLSAIFLSSCELIFMQPNPGTTPKDIFEEAWTFADREYSFFDFKGIDWDSVKRAYEPLVEDDMNDVELFDLLAQMLFILRDGHVNLRAPFDFSRNWTWYLNSPPNYDADILERNYYKTNQRFLGPFVLTSLEMWATSITAVLALQYPKDT